MEALHKSPDHGWLGINADVCSLRFQGPDYHGYKTLVFAFYASPSKRKGNLVPENGYPGILVIHGGGGRAFSN